MGPALHFEKRDHGPCVCGVTLRWNGYDLAERLQMAQSRNAWLDGVLRDNRPRITAAHRLPPCSLPFETRPRISAWAKRGRLHRRFRGGFLVGLWTFLSRVFVLLFRWLQVGAQLGLILQLVLKAGRARLFFLSMWIVLSCGDFR